MLQAERREDADAAPEHFEFAFGLGDSTGSFRFEAGPAAVVQLMGRMDRVDRLPGDELQVVDYKSGRSERCRSDSFDGGRQLQLPLYLLAAAHLFGAKEGRARYLFAADQKYRRQFTLEMLRERMGDLRRVVGLILDGIASGEFFLLPNDDGPAGHYCEQYCPCQRICGPARARLSEIKAASPGLKRLKELREIQ